MKKLWDKFMDLLDPIRQIVCPRGCDKELMKSLKQARKTFGSYTYKNVQHKMTQKQINLYDDYVIIYVLSPVIASQVSRVINPKGPFSITILICLVCILILLHLDDFLIKKIIDLGEK